MATQLPGSELPHLHPQYLEDVKNSCCVKFSNDEYEYIIGRIENAVDVVTRSMINAYDHGYGFLKLVIHPGSTQESMAIIYEKVINQTPWKYKRTAISFVEAVDTLFKFISKNQDILERIQADNHINPKDNLLDAISELTVNYILKLIEQEKTYLAS